jgi:hypothetical protein
MSFIQYLDRWFAYDDAGWINASTIVSAVGGIVLSVLGILFSVFAFRFSNRQNQSSDRLLKELKDISEAIQANTEAIQTNTETIKANTESINKNTKILRLDTIRNLYENTKEWAPVSNQETALDSNSLTLKQKAHLYWHYRWRFETYDQVSLSVFRRIRGTSEQVSLGACTVDILGFSDKADHIGFENRKSEHYIVKMVSFESGGGQEFPFQQNELAAVFDVEGRLTLSKGIDVYTTEEQYPCMIVGIGRIRSFSGVPPTADTVTHHLRIKDN